MIHLRLPMAIVVLSGLGVCPLLAAERVALLTNGNILRGEIQQLGGSVIVKTETSELHLPSADVELVRPDLRQVYEVKASKLTPQAASSRASLIRWCLRHNLRSEANHELRRLAHFHPRHPGIDTLRKQVQRQPIHRTTLLPTESPLHQDVQFAKKHLDVLSKGTVSDFVHTVQPLLTNRCAMAGCHGKTTQSPYTLLSGLKGRAPQSVTHRNLGATLRQIGHYPTEQTLLWMSARAPHGGAKKPALSAHEQEKVFAWIQRVNADQGVASRPRVTKASNESPVQDVDPFDPRRFNELTKEEEDALQLIPPPSQ